MKNMIEQEQEKRLPRVGKIRIGKRHPQKGYPISLDYFRATGKYAGKFHNQYGEKPEKIRIIFPSNEISDIVQLNYKYYKSDGLFCIGDGDEAHRSKKGEMKEIICPCDHKGNECKEVLTLTFLLPEIPVVGVWQVITKSENTKLNIFGALELTQKMTNGQVAGIPMDLRVEEKKSNLSGSKKKYSVISLTPNVSTENLLALKQNISTKQLYRQLTASTERSTKQLSKQTEVETDVEIEEAEVEQDVENEMGIIDKIKTEILTILGDNDDQLEDCLNYLAKNNYNRESFGDMTDDDLSNFLKALEIAPEKVEKAVGKFLKKQGDDNNE